MATLVNAAYCPGRPCFRVHGMMVAELMAVWIKICGITCVEDALLCADAGADAIGVNLVEGSRRSVDIPTARAVAEAVAGRLEAIAVVADLPGHALAELRRLTHIDWLQLHGVESPAELEAALPRAYKAVRIGAASDVDSARRYGGERVLVDARVEGLLGGTGERFDWTLVETLVAERSVVLAGGLDPASVGEAVRRLRPWGVDVASGVEAALRRKDEGRVRSFVQRAREAAL
jgi:phosphoribosylanthranilate isomerase